MNYSANITPLRRILVIIATVFAMAAGLPLTAEAADGLYFVRGIVRDSVTDAPLPYASVVAPGSNRGTVADESGVFEISVPEATRALSVSCMGYMKKDVPLRRGQVNLYNVLLSPESTQLREVVVRKQKYSKKNNPAVDFVNRLKARAHLGDPMRHPYYGYDKYERITIALNDFDPAEHAGTMKRFPFLAEHVDTSDVSGKPILNLSVKEKSARVSHRRSPEASRETVRGWRTEGMDELADPASMQTFLEDVMREIDLYQADINILQNRFVSPLSRIAPDFYKFYLTDTVEVEGERCIVLSFYPHNRAAFGFVGHVYVPEADSTMFIKRVEMKMPRGINLNFVENLYIAQTYTRAPDGSRLRATDDFVMEAKLMPGTPGMYVRRNTVYSGHSFGEIPDSVFDGLGRTVNQPGYDDRPEEFWQEARLVEISKGENSVGQLMKRLRAVPLYYWSEKILKMLFTGYTATGKNSKFDFGPMNTTISYDKVEGVRLRAGGMTTANLSKRWFGRGYVARGFRDHKWKYMAEAEYSFRDKKYHSREFPMHSLRATSKYDIDRPGQHYLFTSQDNFVLSLKRRSDDHVTYQRLNKLEYILELENNFSVTATIANDRQEATPWLPFTDGHGNRYGHYTQTSFAVELRYAPGEKFFQTRSYRFPVNLDAPAITLRHTYSPKGFAGSMFDINKTELNVQKRWWFSAFGYLDVYAGGGYVWSRSPFLNLFIPNANLSYTIQPESFALMNPMEFINTAYGLVDITYWANGAIFNYIPYFKKLKLREVFAFRGLYGHMASRSNPALHPELFSIPADVNTTPMEHGPYMEASVGIDNIFKCLRLDYVWRLSYLDVPYPIDRHGLRLAVHMTF